MMIFFSLPIGQLSVSDGDKGRRTVCKQLWLDQRRMTLDLVHGRNNPSLFDDLLQHFHRKVGYSHSFDLLGLLGDPNHFLPGSSNSRSIKINSFSSIFVIWS
jgi:hypothetical protein